MTDNHLPSTAWAATAPVTVSQADRDRVQTAIRNARSPQTRRAYASAWKAWEAWGASRGASALPAQPLELAAYLAERAESASIATVRMASAAITFVHKVRGVASPVTAEVSEVLRGLAASSAATRGRGQARASRWGSGPGFAPPDAPCCSLLVRSGA